MKYPRTYHFSFSPEVHSDDKVCDMNDLQKIIDNEIDVVISEKLDGGCCCLSPKGVFARSHSQETSCSSFNYIKNVYYYPNLMDISNDDLCIYGENLFAIHSVTYDELTDYFYVFNILDNKTKMFQSITFVTEWCKNHNIKMVPFIYQGKIKSIEWLETFLNTEIKKPSQFGKEKEGFVLRISDEFHADNFTNNVFKYVRRGHVQTKDHWSKNWKQATLIK